MRQQKVSRFPLFIAFITLIAISLPYLVAFLSGGSEYQFSGFLINPLDGITYIAKMVQGWQGNWVYRMVYSVQPGAGAYINLFYLALGHLARVLALPLLGVYHGFRLIGAILMLWALWRFYGLVFPQAERPRRTAFVLSAIGSGLGWLLLPFGAITSDFWVSEAFPFLSAYTNPHFPISLALMLTILAVPEKMRWQTMIGRGLLAFLLSLISPFALVVVGVILAADAALYFIRKNNAAFPQWNKNYLSYHSLILISGTPALLYDVWLTRTDPVIAAWNAQNINPAPRVWDFLIAFAPALIFAVLGWKTILKPRRPIDFESLFAPLHLRVFALTFLWAVLGIGLIYLPLGFQRRFIIGLWIPWSAMAAWGVEQLAQSGRKPYRFWSRLLITIAIPTNLLVIVIGLFGVQTHDERIYLTTDEVRALAWVEANTPPDALILASPEMGAFIPANTGRRVIYGHPFETINAEVEKNAVEQFFSGNFDDTTAEDFLISKGVSVILFGPREQSLGPLPSVNSVSEMQQIGDVLILGVNR